MKKLLGVMAILSVTFFVVKVNKNSEVKKISLKDVPMFKTLANKVEDRPIVTTETPDLSAEDFEEKIVDKDNEEIRKEIAKNEDVIKSRNFIVKANNNELTKAEEKEFVQSIRLNAALNKVLIERKLDDLESEKI